MERPCRAEAELSEEGCCSAVVGVSERSNIRLVSQCRENPKLDSASPPGRICCDLGEEVLLDDTSLGSPGEEASSYLLQSCHPLYHMLTEPIGNLLLAKQRCGWQAPCPSIIRQGVEGWIRANRQQFNEWHPPCLWLFSRPTHTSSNIWTSIRQ